MSQKISLILSLLFLLCFSASISKVILEVIPFEEDNEYENLPTTSTFVIMKESEEVGSWKEHFPHRYIEKVITIDKDNRISQENEDGEIEDAWPVGTWSLSNIFSLF